MADKQLHVGDVVDIVVELEDEDHFRTDVFDKARGVTYTLSQPESAMVADEDANPLDAVMNVTGLTDGDAMLTVDLDGDPTEGENLLHFESETYEVAPGPATGGRVTLTIRPVAPPPTA